jgi:hypothetical protein
MPSQGIVGFMIGGYGYGYGAEAGDAGGDSYSSVDRDQAMAVDEVYGTGQVRPRA